MSESIHSLQINCVIFFLPKSWYFLTKSFSQLLSDQDVNIDVGKDISGIFLDATSYLWPFQQTYYISINEYSHYKDRTVVLLDDGNSYKGNTSSLYWNIPSISQRFITCGDEHF